DHGGGGRKSAECPVALPPYAAAERRLIICAAPEPVGNRESIGPKLGSKGMQGIPKWLITSKGGCSKCATAACWARAGSARTPTTAPAIRCCPIISMVSHIPGNVLNGNFRVALYLDEGTSDPQQEALLNVYGGKLGGPGGQLAEVIGEGVSGERAPSRVAVK